MIARNHNWLANYIAFRGRRFDHGYWQAEVYFLALLARGFLSLCEEEKIIGDANNERVCRFILKRIRRMADFRQLTHAGESEYLMQIRTAQIRIEGMGIK
jgi:hypothetical protein